MEEDELPSIYRMLELADVQQGETVVDLATGTAIVPNYVLSLVGPSGTVFGVDPSANMLKQVTLTTPCLLPGDERPSSTV